MWQICEYLDDEISGIVCDALSLVLTKQDVNDISAIFKRDEELLEGFPVCSLTYYATPSIDLIIIIIIKPCYCNYCYSH